LARHTSDLLLKFDDTDLGGVGVRGALKEEHNIREEFGFPFRRLLQ
jgi:hypothetical protein